MDVTMMLDTKANSTYCACWMTYSGSPAWLLLMQRVISSCKWCIQHEGIHAKAPSNWSLLPHLWRCCMLTLPALRQQCSWINPHTWWTFWSFVTILWSICDWSTWPPIKLWKLLLGFCGKVMSWFSEHWQSSWVTEGPTLKATSSERFASL